MGLQKRKVLRAGDLTFVADAQGDITFDNAITVPGLISAGGGIKVTAGNLAFGSTEVIDSTGKIDWGRIKNSPAYSLKTGDTYTGNHDFTGAAIIYGRDTDSAKIHFVDYGANMDWLTLEFGDDAAQDRIRFRWAPDASAILDILSDHVRAYKPIKITGTNGLEFVDYAGGWFMNDTSWIRALNNKSIYTSGTMQADSQIQTGYLISTGNARIDGDLSIGATTRAADTFVRMRSSDGYRTVLELCGASQGSGLVYVGQDTNYGGGILYDGDATPALKTGGKADALAIFRRNAGADEVVAYWDYNSNDMIFRGTSKQEKGSQTTMVGITLTKEKDTKGDEGNSICMVASPWPTRFTITPSTAAVTKVHDGDIPSAVVGTTTSATGCRAWVWQGDFAQFNNKQYCTAIKDAPAGTSWYGTFELTAFL